MKGKIVIENLIFLYGMSQAVSVKTCDDPEKYFDYTSM